MSNSTIIPPTPAPSCLNNAPLKMINALNQILLSGHVVLLDKLEPAQIAQKSGCAYTLSASAHTSSR